MKKNIKHPAIFLDRDGVIIVEKEFQIEPRNIEFLPGAIEALRSLPDDFLKVVISNQSGVARGFFTRADVSRFNQALNDRLRRDNITIDGWYFCPHGPNDNCSCRKPKPGMILTAAEELGIDVASSWIIGDKSSDIIAGAAAGVRTILVATGYAGAEPGAVAMQPDYRADNLDAAVAIINHERARVLDDQ